MTKADLQNTPNFHADTARALSRYLRDNIPRGARTADATSLVNNEGRMNGFLDAVELIDKAISKEPEKETVKAQMYSESQHPQNTNKS